MLYDEMKLISDSLGLNYMLIYLFF